ncbi:MAG: GtrA family protein [Ruminiclostridium sp.]|nr:GtrA family protein [Ruminiclostridium sp.]
MSKEKSNAPQSKKTAVLQFIKFGLVGVSNTLVNYITYLIFVSLGVHYVIANAIGFIISVLNAYFWGSRFVFKEDDTKEKRVWWKVLLKCYAAYLFGFILNTVLLWVWVDVTNIGQYFGFVGDILNWVTGLFGLQPGAYTPGKLSEILAPVINIFVTVPINFVINKFWAYRQKKIPEKAKDTENTADITDVTDPHTDSERS